MNNELKSMIYFFLVAFPQFNITREKIILKELVPTFP